MKKIVSLIVFCTLFTHLLFCQTDTTTIENVAKEEDPTNIRTRTSLFSELQALQNGEYLNVTTARAIMPIGKKFSTRLDIPWVYYSKAVANYDQMGLGDISLRLLGYQIFQNPKAALIASIECSFNTAASPLLGSGKNILIPVVAYSKYLPKTKSIVALSFQYFYSFSGDSDRADVNFSKVQLYYIQALPKNMALLVLPELFYVPDTKDVSMNLEASLFYKVSKKFAVWGKGGVGLFGNFGARYDWTTEVGVRYLLVTKPIKLMSNN